MSNLIEIKDLKKHFSISQGGLFRKAKTLKAVDGVTLSISKGETFGLVGESGCGKSTLGRTLVKLYEATEGSYHFDGIDITKYSDDEMLPLRKRMGMIFQDSYSSLDPRLTVGEIIGRGLELHNIAKGKEREARVKELLATVGLKDEHYNRYPHEFSGGQRQRIGIARALALEPEFIVCDEPISALDVSIQAQVINILVELQERLGLTYLFISHDLSMVRHISHKVGVMYLGNLVEVGDVDEIFNNPKHPYTKALLSAVPVADPNIKSSENRVILKGDVPSPMNPPSGCPFRTRCPIVSEICSQEKPLLMGVENHKVACHNSRV